MLSIVALLLLAAVSPPPADDTVLVKDPPGVQRAGSGQDVLGWRRVPADSVRPGDEFVPNVYLDLLAPDPEDEPLGSDQWAHATVETARAWQETTGRSDVVIAVVDSGLDLEHPDLVDRIFTNPGEIPDNGIDDDGNGLVDDVHGWDVVGDDNDPSDPSVGHGTEVAGVAVASLNGFGISGVAPTATILPIRACTTSCELFHVAWAITYATDLGADIINLSLGGFAQPGPLADAVDYAEAAGVLVVAAAGNTGTDIDGTSFVPADLPNANLVAVAATDVDDRLWEDSNYGRTSVEMAAPGAGIVTTTLDSLGTHRTVSGTSFAAPHVAGTAALMLSLNPELTPPELIDTLGSQGQPLGDLAETTIYGTRLRVDRSTIAAQFRDIDGTFVHDIIWLATEGITRGCNPPQNDRYCPDRPVSRGELAAFLDRAIGLEAGPDAFIDDDDSIFEGHINALAHAGITHGCNPPQNDRFCPEQDITRGQLAALLHRALQLPHGPDSFVDDDGSIFEDHINALAHAGITRGCNPPQNDHFCPHRPVTRGEVAAFLHRAFG